MSIATELTALQQDITNARTAITTKGGTVTSGGGTSQLATDIASIPSGTEYYNVYRYTGDGEVTLLGTTTHPEKSFASCDDFIFTNIYVFDGNLYSLNNGTTRQITYTGDVTWCSGRTINSSYYALYIDGGKLYRIDAYRSTMRIGNDTTWTKCFGYCSTSSTGDRAFALKSDGLYYISGGSSVTKISSITNWTDIKGYGANNTLYYAYGISEGKLYKIYANGSGISQVGTDTTWTKICGSYENDSWYGLGINNGRLYRLKNTIQQVGTDTTWTAISGSISSSNTFKAMGINNGSLYTIDNSNVTRVGTSNYWVNCSGYITSEYKGLAYTDNPTELYGIDFRNKANILNNEGDAGDSYYYCGQHYGDVHGVGIVVKKITPPATYTPILPKQLTNGKLEDLTESIYAFPDAVIDLGDFALQNICSDNSTITWVNANFMQISGSSALDNAFYGCRNLATVNFRNLRIISGITALNNAFNDCGRLVNVNFQSLQMISGMDALIHCFYECVSLQSISFPLLNKITGQYAFQEAFGYCEDLTSVSFPALNSQSFGNYTNQFKDMLDMCNSCVVHFPSNLQSVIGNWTDVKNGFSGNNTQVKFDLPATY